MLEEELDKTVKTTFNYLPEDHYLKSSKKFRKRRYSTGSIIDNIFSWDTAISEFEQNILNNNYLGGIKRKYESLCSTIKSFVSDKLIQKIILSLPNRNYKVGVHQIRVIANDTTMGVPVPEGIHQDGFDYVFILCVSNKNVIGGNSILLTSKNYKDIFFEYVLQPKDCLLINDRKLFHYTSPIVPKLPGKCTRDVIIITFINNKFNNT
ncbi:MAG: 2OG-Fe dioxygenase family protein [Rickettsiales bacterium]|nr:2OG-Fe dioxygenase family protein [Rickettsiales bacterium]